MKLETRSLAQLLAVALVLWVGLVVERSLGLPIIWSFSVFWWLWHVSGTTQQLGVLFFGVTLSVAYLLPLWLGTVLLLIGLLGIWQLRERRLPLPVAVAAATLFVQSLLFVLIGGSIMWWVLAFQVLIISVGVLATNWREARLLRVRQSFGWSVRLRRKL